MKILKLTTTEPDPIVNTAARVFVVSAIHSDAGRHVTIGHKVDDLIKIGLDFFGRVVNGRNADDLRLDVVVVWAGGQVAGRGVDVSDFVVALAVLIVAIHPRAAVAGISDLDENFGRVKLIEK